MSEPRKPSLILPVAVAMLLLLAGYVGAYYWLLDVAFDSADHVTLVPIYYSIYFSERFEYDSWEWSWRLTPFFAPIHWFDRRIRPHVWEPTP
jgi:hypothetical protein